MAVTTTYSHEIDVTLTQSTGSDLDIARAAWVSTKGARTDEEDLGRIEGLLKFLMSNGHGTPFEHNSMTFLVSAPIFVWREHMRHRIGISYNEESGRYKVLEPKFYIPEHSRVQTGKPGAYAYEEGTAEQDATMKTFLETASSFAYSDYETLLRTGIAREVARMILPLNIYSSAYVTFNARSLMNFLELRLAETAMLEIRMLAKNYFKVFQKLFPITASLFEGNGLVAP